ncbi:MAG: sulfatase-like hydrolase/transferase [Armatimonadota bacterium]|jgi:arylsulfatase A-like enzyme
MSSRSRGTANSASAIDRRQFIRSTAGALALSGVGLPEAARGAERTSRPNVLLIITDQQHMDTIRAGGCRHTKTPALDWLHRRGVSFAQSYSANPVCSPARSSIFTGRPTVETEVCVNGRHIRSGIPNIGEWFARNTDYERVYSGKWHLPRTHQSTIEGFRVLPTGIGGQGNIGDTCTSRACEAFLRNRSGDRPFLLVASFMQPHDICEWLRLNMNNPGRLPYAELADELPPLPENFEYDRREPQHVRDTRQKNEPAKGGWDQRHWRYYRWSYYRHVEMVDGEIGRILRGLQEAGADEDTLIVLTVDHGEGMGHHQTVRKSRAYDEAARVPLLVSWPGQIRKNKTDAGHLVTGMDIMPTLCDYAGIEPPPDVRGASLRPLLEGGPARWRGHIVTEVPGGRGRAVRTERYKYVAYDEDPMEQLFDMRDDPGETRNLAADGTHASMVEEHKRLLVEWERQLDPAPKAHGLEAWWRTA